MESSLHRALKERHGTAPGGRCEVTVDGFRIDAIDAEGILIEIQSAPLGAIRSKIARLIETRRVRVVKPVVLSRRIVRRESRDGPEISSRRSPYRGEPLDVFDDFVGLARVFPHPNLTVEVLCVDVAEIRAPLRRGGRRERLLDRILLSTGESRLLAEAADLWSLLSSAPEPGEAFTTKDLAERLGRRPAFAQRVAYCLRHAGAALDLGKTSRHRLYARPSLIERKAEEIPAYERAPEVSPRRKDRLRHRG